jgi:precorrin-6B methylase 2
MLAIIGLFALIIILLALLVFLLTFAVYQSSRTRVGYIPLPERAVPAVIAALQLSPGAVVYDLGCGDGRILAAALADQPQAHGVGIEYHPMVARLARWRLRSQSQRARIVRGDILKHDLRPATHLFTYLNPPTMALLEPKLDRELQPGARLVACDFKLPTKKPVKTIKIGEPRQLGQRLYLYEY